MNSSPWKQLVVICICEIALILVNLEPYGKLYFFGSKAYLVGPVISLVIIISVIKILSSKVVYQEKQFNNRYFDFHELNATSLLRPIAAYLVFYTHARLVFGVSATKSNLFATILFYFPAWLGMGIFFCLSGFLMSLLFKQRRYVFNTNSMISFFRKRFVRIAPMAVIVSFLIFIAYLGSDKDFSVLFRVLTFQYNGDFGPNPIKPQWSLTTEIQFYLIFPLIFFGILKLSKLKASNYMIPVILLFGALIRLAIFGMLGFDITKWSQYIYVPLYGNLDFFLIGAFVPFIKKGEFRDREMRAGTSKRNYFILFLAATVMYLLYSTLTYFSMDFEFVKFQLPFVIIGPTIISFFTIPILFTLGEIDLNRQSSLTRKFIIKSAEITFPFYLLHVAVLTVFKNLGLHGNFHLILITCLGTTIVLSYILLALNKLLKLEQIFGSFFTKILNFLLQYSRKTTQNSHR